MKTAIKLVLLGAGLAAGAANAAIIPVTDATGSSLVLFVRNITEGTYFVQEVTGANVGDVKTISDLADDGVGTYSLDVQPIGFTPGLLTVPSQFGSFASSSLDAYLGDGNGTAGTTADNILWTIMAGRRGAGTADIGQQSLVFTSQADYTQENTYASSAQVGDAVTGVQFTFDNVNTAACALPGTCSTGWSGDAAEATWLGGGNWPGGASLGSAQSLYLLDTADGAAANVYRSAATLNLSLNGGFTYSAADLEGGTTVVPLPAAVWLLGSGLMGLAGIGRRRKAVVAA